MKKIINGLIVLITLVVTYNAQVYAHCEIPCGIYEDTLRVQMISEHISTIEKSMKKIKDLSDVKETNYNQLVRWVNNKEQHANKIQDIVSQYFLHQRIKIKESTDKDAFAKYNKNLVLLHKLLVYSMKSKQSIDLKNIEMMRSILKTFSQSYFHKH